METATDTNTTAPKSDSTPNIVLTAAAIAATKKALNEEKLSNDHGLRIAVRGGGCSGLEYALDFTNEERMGDTIMTFDGLKVFIDMASKQYLEGTEIDYVSSLQGAGFKFKNPNAKRTCGCGSSFS